MLLKKQILSFVIMACCVFSCRSDFAATKFLTNFFRDRNVMITGHFCWSYDHLKKLLRNLGTGEKSKQTAVYNNSTEFGNFLGYLDTNNYFVLDMNNCEASWRLLNKVNQLQLFRYPLKWLLLTIAPDFGKLTATLKTYSIYPTSDVIVSKRQEDYYELLQPYRIDHAKDIIWENYGSWSEEMGLVEKLRNIPPPQRRSNLQQTEMNVTLVIRDEDTWNHLEDFRNLDVDMFIKQNWMAVKCLLEYCNIRSRLLKSADHGYLNKTTGRWSGVIGDVYYGKAQLSGSAILLTHERYQAVDMLAMLNPSKIRFVLRKPPLSYMSNIFVLPFYWTVWIAAAAALCLFAMALYVILNWETKYKAKVDAINEGCSGCVQDIGKIAAFVEKQASEAEIKINSQQNFGVNDVILITFETLCQQGTMTESRTISGRTITLIFLMGFMFLYVAYSANIVALLQSTMQITSLDQLLNSRMGVGGQDVYYMKNYLTGAKDRVRQELYRKKIGPTGYYSLEDGVEKIRQGFFALHMELGRGYHHILQRFTDYELCSLQELEGYAKSPGGYACVPKNSPYREVILVGFLKVEEYGLRRRNYDRVVKEPKCYSKGASFESVGIMDAYPAILMWIYGVVFALFIFVLEKMLHKMKTRQLSDSTMQHNNYFREEAVYDGYQ